MEVVLLGSGTALPDAARGPAGIAVMHGGSTWLIDGGSGTLQRGAQAGLDMLGLTGGVYTHRHVDHTGDLVPLLFAMRVGGRPAPYPVVAGEGFRAFLDGLHAVYGSWIEPPGGVEVQELPLDRPSTVDLGGLTLRTAPANHTAGALHLRFEADGAAMVFSGDTDVSDALVDLAQGADLLICECAGSDSSSYVGHLSPSAVEALLDASRPRLTWLTHFYPGSDPVAAVARMRAAGHDVRHAADGDRWAPLTSSATH